MSETMNEARLRFWLEPWHWADCAWHRQYGAPACAANVYAERLLFGGWAAAFGLQTLWKAPRDPRWTCLLSVAPQTLRDAAAMLGWVGIVRAPGGAMLLRNVGHDRLLRRALRYRDVNCIEATIGLEGHEPSPQAFGLRMLQRMAEADWPEVGPRIAMMLPPGAHSGRSALRVHHLAVARCLTIWIAAARWLSGSGCAEDENLS